MKRYARVTGARAVTEVAAYLPENYTVREDTWEIAGASGRFSEVIIEGEDRAGWTLGDYVIPRLASGSMAAREVYLWVAGEGGTAVFGDYPKRPDVYDTTSDEFLDKVESEWFRIMQGDLMLVGEERDKRAVAAVTELAGFGQLCTRDTAPSVDQYDGKGDLIPEGIISADEMARRVAEALALVLFGGEAR